MHTRTYQRQRQQLQGNDGSSESAGTNANRSIMATANDAVFAKHATVEAGYYDDPFLEPFCRQSTNTGIVGASGEIRPGSGFSTLQQQHRQYQCPRRRQVQPIIKRGTHARVCCMDRAVSNFLRTPSKMKQVVILGAGKDTSFFRYRAGLLMSGTSSPCIDKGSVKWVEVDQTTVVIEKAKTMQSSRTLFFSTKLGINAPSSALQPSQHGYHLDLNDGGKSSYSLVEHDLRESPQSLLEKLNLDADVPTLFALECVLMYLPDTSSRDLLKALSTATNDTVIACYEPILGSDPFGHVMERNLTKANVAIPESSLLRTRTIYDQMSKVMSSGFSSKVVGCDMWQAYETILSHDQRQRANKAEFLDELEEWTLIMKHYCFLVAHGGKKPSRFWSDTFCNVGKDSAFGFSAGKCLVYP